MEFKIEKDKPMPKNPHRGEVACKVRAALNQMVVGDSFEFPAKIYHSVRVIVSQENASGEKRFSTRRIDSDLRRCWRVE